MGIEEIKDIEIEKTYNCLICGKKTTGKVCSKEHQIEWIKKNTKPLPVQTTTKNEIKKFNEHPDTKKHGVIAIKKSTYWTIIGFASLLILLLTIQIVWSNSILSSKEFNSSIEVNNPITVNPAQTDISNNYNNNNNHTINVDVNLNYTEISKMIADKVKEMINDTA